MRSIVPGAHPTGSTTLRRRFGRMAVGLALGVAALAQAQATVAAAPGALNRIQCFPTSQAIIQELEAYRSFMGEYVILQGALVDRVSGATFYSEWVTGTGAAANGAVLWRPVPRGGYDVFYRWASWVTSSATYSYSTWIEVTGGSLQTFGTETYPGSGVFIGGRSGECTI